MPIDAPEAVKIARLKANPNNPRVLRDEKFAKLKQSIQDFPDMLNKRPIVAVTDLKGDYMVLGGNMRLRACMDLKMKEVPVILADEWTEEQRREFIIKDNVGYGEWDWDQLANEWDAGELADWGLQVHVAPDFNVDDFFKDSGKDKEVGAHSIVLNYTEDEHQKVLVRLAEIGGSREQAVYKALGL